MRALTLRQRVFVKFLLETLNPTEAALKAYKIKDGNRHVAANIASENMAKPVIQEYLNNGIISDDEIVARLRGCLGAKREIKGNSGRSRWVDDFSVQLQALELVFKVKGFLDGRQGVTQGAGKVTVEFVRQTLGQQESHQ